MRIEFRPKDKDKGCCGCPPTCTTSGRCKAREEYLEQQEQKPEAGLRRTFMDKVRAHRGDAVIEQAREEVRREQARDRDLTLGRTR